MGEESIIISALAGITSVVAGFFLFFYRKKSVPTGFIIPMIGVFVFILIKDLLSQNQIINFFERQGFNNVAIMIISMFIAIGLELVLIYFIVKYQRKKMNRKKRHGHE
jgi:LPXTG-motif cell wall-anchored protein